jgi:hypothetical protein
MDFAAPWRRAAPSWPKTRDLLLALTEEGQRVSRGAAAVARQVDDSYFAPLGRERRLFADR